MIFNDVIEAIKSLFSEERQKNQKRLKQYLREKHHEEIFEDFKLAQVE
ncbi:hypothetical protein Cri9333_2159 [Crinalium epipsammum PCC 9333]|uniref:Uncharacterized protein n=1 Tax=Crinalium epipsammum PCC 9333 TaxID=1173022 RepID=K9VZU0_9CYAN|nr:hypothetical protein Cri9333_2159 [Crinalium epipsammum PCC 9333]